MTYQNFYEKWYKDHKNYTIRPYANRILNEELPKAFIKNNIVVLAAAPNSGKTLLSIAWMEKYLIDNPTHKILVLTHGQSLLRNQFYNDIKQSRVNFSFEKITKSKDFHQAGKQVLITLPHTIINVIDEVNSFNVLIVDEAHHFYYAEDGMVARIIDRYKFEKQLLLTGTPAIFVAHKMEIIAVALEELIEGEWASDPIIVISNSTYDIKEKDFNASDELKKEVKLDKAETFETLNRLLTIIERYMSKTGWTNSIQSLGKTMIVAKNTSQAKDIQIYFNSFKIETLISTYNTDRHSDIINRFIEDDINIIIVVDRGILGFNLPTLVNIIDMKCGKNISNLFQLFNRITRLHPEGNQKYFFKIVPESHENEYLYMLSAAISLIFKDNYIKYNGTPDELVIPILKIPMKQEDNGKKNKGKAGWKFEPIKYIDIPVYRMWKQSNENFSWNTLKSIHKDMYHRRWSEYTIEVNYQYCLETVKNYYKIA
ncbi:type I restriction-modification system, restriction subunit R [Aquipluma nitroreducens]|uniref:Type I restriction-modification system, restriction subunit R n=1 Tax=Aquipluma nitroreducens TaxID=2010828 RepID=A0A5K7SAT6_9BACT|nr:DEAD/DEAH box helicase family protein [Aquipluma nitroreducens]BBE18557.1 type I restriction-modification system, restriction subunit R [Aquipluma nitroreducens]